MKDNHLRSCCCNLPRWARFGAWVAGLLLIAYLCLNFMLDVVLGWPNIERHVIAKNRENVAELKVLNPGAFSSYDTVISVSSRSLFARPCRAFNIRRTDVNRVNIYWLSKDHLLVSVSEDAEVEPWEDCSSVTFTIEREPEPRRN